jgi:hypothetical protein
MYTEEVPPSKYNSLYASNNSFISTSIALNFSDGRKHSPSSIGGLYLFDHGELYNRNNIIYDND